MNTSEALVLQRYTLQHRLQQRDHTTTWQALDQQTQSPVVVKILDLDDSPDWQAYAHFEREAKTLKTLAHPQIPQFLAFEAETEQQRVVLVQEAISGESLRTRMAKGWKVTETQARALADQVLELLQILHQQEPPLIHRDIKPENLLLDDQNRVYLIDFGAVRQFTQNSYTVAGSFSYMAPEQLQGKAVPTSDLYGLGMTLIELLSGSPLESLPREGLYVKFQDHVFVSEALKRWLEHLIAPYPVQRFTSAQAAQEALHSKAYLPELKQRGTLGASHGKQELTPHIWLQAKKEGCKLEFTGQKLDWRNGFYLFATHLTPVVLWVVPFLLMVFNDFYGWFRIPSLGGADFIFIILGVSIFPWPFILWFLRRFLRRTSTHHTLELTKDNLTHSYKKNRGIRAVKTYQKSFPLNTVKGVYFNPFQIVIERKSRLSKHYRFTLMVPFDASVREQVAKTFARYGVSPHV